MSKIFLIPNLQILFTYLIILSYLQCNPAHRHKDPAETNITLTRHDFSSCPPSSSLKPMCCWRRWFYLSMCVYERYWEGITRECWVLGSRDNDDGLTFGKRLTLKNLENMEAKKVLHFVPSGKFYRGGVGWEGLSRCNLSQLCQAHGETLFTECVSECERW